MTKKVWFVGLLAAGAFAAEGYKVIGKIKIGGTGGWDYVAVDPDAGRVVRIARNIGGSRRPQGWESGRSDHAIARRARHRRRARIRQGIYYQRPIQQRHHFRPENARQSWRTANGQNPDSVCFEPKTKHIFTFNGRSSDSTAIDPKTNEVIKSFPLGGKPEECAVRRNRQNLRQSRRLERDYRNRRGQTGRAAACLPFAVRISLRSGDRCQEQETLLGLRQQDDGRNRYRDAQSDRDSADWAGHRRRGI